MKTVLSLRSRLRNQGSGYATPPQVEIAPPPDKNAANIAVASATLDSGEGLQAVSISNGGMGYDPTHPPKVTLKGGASFDPKLNPTDVDPDWYIIGILTMAFVTGAYVIVGGLKAVIITDVIQSVLLLLAGLLVAFITFSQPEIGGWAGLVERDSGDGGADRLHLYNSSDHLSAALDRSAIGAYDPSFLLLGNQPVYSPTSSFRKIGKGGSYGYHCRRLLQTVDPLFFHRDGYGRFLPLQ